MQLTGIIIKIGDIQTFDSGFQKRELVIRTNEKYPQEISIELLKDNVGLVDNLKVGSTVTVSINIQGRSWQSPQGETKYFNSITGWKVAKEGSAEPSNDDDDDLFP